MTISEIAERLGHAKATITGVKPKAQSELFSGHLPIIGLNERANFFSLFGPFWTVSFPESAVAEGEFERIGRFGPPRLDINSQAVFVSLQGK